MRPHRRGSSLSVVLLFAVYGAIHSAFASRRVKEYAERAAGTRLRNGLYRPFYIVQAIVTTWFAARQFLRLPDRELYQVRKPYSLILTGVQVAGLALLASAVHVVGIRRITGFDQLLAFTRGEHPAAEPEAQGPPLASSGDVDARGPFRYFRHPDNLPIILVAWGFARMTVNRLTLAVLATIYAILGSWHEDARLHAAYGRSFDSYRRRLPMMIPSRTRQLLK